MVQHPTSNVQYLQSHFHWTAQLRIATVKLHKSLYNLIVLLYLSVYVYLCRGWFFSRAVPAKEVHVREDLDIPKNGQLKISTY